MRDGDIASLAMVTLDWMVNDVGGQFPQPSTFSGTVMAKMKMQRFFMFTSSSCSNVPSNSSLGFYMSQLTLLNCKKFHNQP
jgi:hypothetical protein